MLIERVQIDDGFLKGLDVGFTAGLNVLIGARGTGKTSLIELIRFALGAPSFTEEARRRGHQQALSVLQDGRVNVLLRDGDDRFLVSRSARDEAPRTPRPLPLVTILAQSEIEAVGAQSNGRLQLIDRLRSGHHQSDRRGSSLASEIRSITEELSTIRGELRLITDRISDMRTVHDELREAQAQQENLLRSIAASTKDQKRIADLQRHVGLLAARRDVYQRTHSTLETFLQSLRSLTNLLPELEEWPSAAGHEDTLADLRFRRFQIEVTMKSAVGLTERALEELATLQRSNTDERLSADEQARKSRRALDELQAGAGAMARKVEELTERAAQHEALQGLLSERESRVSSLLKLRRQRFSELESVRSARFNSRRGVADRLNSELMPKIRTELLESGATERYANAVITSLRGSGLHYNALAPIIAESMSPLELTEAIEGDDAEAITDATDISYNRAQNVISYLHERSLNDIIAAPIEDAVELSLLDGTDYKSSSMLSIGQRCTVVLPLLLSGHGELLIVDQPEDHLDNAFISDTLVQRLRKRKLNDQYILASHNANIPVLGDAERVIRLDSDGRRGFISHEGQLNHPDTVTAIITVMEGGVAAFQQRAAFYTEYIDIPDEHRTSY